MSINNLLSRLDKVKKSGPGQWVACCPAHQDKRPSLSVRELDDGRILCHCFSHGCSFESIVSAVGMDMAEFFPPDTALGGEQRKPGLSRPFNPMHALEALGFEATVVLLAAKDVAAGKEVGEKDLKRLLTSIARIQGAIAAARGARRG